MNGIHDMGGMHGLGPIAPEQNEPVWHAPWEARVYALSRAIGRKAAMEMLLTGDFIDATPAQALGLVTRSQPTPSQPRNRRSGDFGQEIELGLGGEIGVDE